MKESTTIKKNQGRCRKIASHQLLTENGQILNLQVVEIRSGKLGCYYPLTGEQAFTEWMSGCLELKYDKNNDIRVFYNGRQFD